MNTELKKRIVFATIMGIVTTSIISFSLTTINAGFSEHFIFLWLRSWIISYFIVIPLITFVGPIIQKNVNKLF